MKERDKYWMGNNSSNLETIRLESVSNSHPLGE